MSVVPEQAKPHLEPPNKRAGYLLGGLGTVTALVTVLGVQSDELADIWRNQPTLSYIAITLVLVGVALGAIAGWVIGGDEGGEQHRERVVLLCGNAALGAGLIVIAWSVIANAASSPTPTVTAVAQQKNGSTTLKAVVEDDKLSSGQGVQLRVDPLYEVEREGGEVGYRVGRPIYSATFGPDTHGSVHRSIRVGIPPGRFEDIGIRASDGLSANCYEEGSRTGCVVVHVPSRADPPRFALGWKHGKLRVHLKAFDVPSGVVQFLARSLSPQRLLARADIAVNLSDDVNRTIVLPVRGARKVCIIASENTKKLHCPPNKRSRSGWAVLRVPTGS